jgi:hypothetical protein
MSTLNNPIVEQLVASADHISMKNEQIPYGSHNKHPGEMQKTIPKEDVSTTILEVLGIPRPSAPYNALNRTDRKFFNHLV